MTDQSAHSNQTQVGAEHRVDIPLAIVGIGCRFPKADSLQEYWTNIKYGVDAISEIPTDTHWDPKDYFDSDKSAPDMTYAHRGGFLNPADFDPLYFGIAPNNIEATDTTQLLGMLVAQQALNDANYETGTGVGDGRAFDRNRCSVIMGVTGTLELVIPLGARLGHPIWRKALKDAGVDEAVADDVVERIKDGYVPWQENSFPGLLGNVAAGRIANRFDIGGSNCVVDAACASSLSAIHMAAMELQTGKADMAITGGLDTFNDIFMYMCFSKTPALSPTGNAKPFSANGDGTILGEGLGVIILKRLEDALRDGDKIYCTIKGIGSSSDGKGNAIYAPSSAGQMKALRNAYKNAGITPDTIGLIEAHGTGTKVGDATEVKALHEVYTSDAATSEKQTSKSNGKHAAIGSVKSMIGHTKSSAGVAGLIKTAMALHHQVLPPTIKVDEPLNELADENCPVYLNNIQQPWLANDGHPRRAAMSAFGFGGSNFHCVLEEHAAKPVGQSEHVDSKAGQHIDWSGCVTIAAFSAGNQNELESQINAFATSVDSDAAITVSEHAAESRTWAGIRQQAASTRSHFSNKHQYRLVLVLERESLDLKKLISRVKQQFSASPSASHWSTPDGASFSKVDTPGKLAFLFPGQGSQYVGMMRDLACTFPQMRQVLNRVGDVAGHIYPVPVFDQQSKDEQEDALRATEIAQPAIGAVSLGALEVLKYFAVVPDATAGHSFGEVTALCAAGYYDANAMRIIAQARGQLMHQFATSQNNKTVQQSDAGSTGGKTDSGSMLAVSSGVDSLRQLIAEASLDNDIVIANHNAPTQVILSGPTRAIEQVQTLLKTKQVRCKKLPVAAAFHSRLVSGAATPFGETLSSIQWGKSDIPVYANTTAVQYPSDETQAKTQLANQLAKPVQFVDMITQMASDGTSTFIEVGPGKVLTGLVDAILSQDQYASSDVKTAVALDSSLGKGNGKVKGEKDLANVLAHIACSGHAVDLSKWDDEFEPISESENANAKPKRKRMTVPLSGANYRSSKPKGRPRVVSSRDSRVTESATGQFVTAPEPNQNSNQEINQTLDTAPTQSSTAAPTQVAAPAQVAPMHSDLTTQPATPLRGDRPVSDPPVSTNPSLPSVANSPHLAQAIELTQQHIAALHRMQEQTANLHRQYLEGQAVAQHTVQQLVMQQQQMLAASLGSGIPISITPLAHSIPQPVPQTAPLPVPLSAPIVQPQLQPVTPAPAPAQVPLPPQPAAVTPVQPIQAAPPVQPQPPAPVAASAPPVASAVVAKPASQPAAVSENTQSEIATTLLEVVADKTGYPVDMLEPEMSLDADLGIDSIKRVEILSALQERLPDAPIVKPEDLGALQTLDQIINFLNQSDSNQEPSASASQAVAVSPVSSPTLEATAAPTQSNGQESEIATVLLEVVADKTGYPVDMLEPDMSLDADLGIDSIKRVEILSALQERLPNAPVVMPEDLGALETLEHIINFLASSDGGGGPAPNSAGQVAHASAEAAGESNPFESGVAADAICVDQWSRRLKRQVLTLNPVHHQRKVIALPHTAPLWITDDGHSHSQALAAALNARGVATQIVPLTQVTQGEPTQPVAGLVIVAPPNCGEQFVYDAFALLQRTNVINAQSAGVTPLLAAVTFLDGAFGLQASFDERSAVSMALSGIVKTAGHECEHISTKVVDVSPLLVADDAAARVATELLIDGPVEVAIDESAGVAHSLDIQEAQITTDDCIRQPLAQGDLVVITGGGRGVTAAVAIELARRFKPTLLLLGRSPLPADEPSWLQDVTEEAEIKRAILANIAEATNGDRTPRAIQSQYKRIVANREIRATLASIEACGAVAVYRSADVCDQIIVAEVIGEVVSQFGPVRGIIHGAGVLADKLVKDKTIDQFQQVFRTKVSGLNAVTSAIDPADLRVLVLFSSSTARFGRKGQVDYAAGNEVLNKLAQRHAHAYPACRVVSVNWGPWDGGMVTPALKKLFASEGVDVIPLDAGARYLCDELTTDTAGPVETVILGRPTTNEATSHSIVDESAAEFDSSRAPTSATDTTPVVVSPRHPLRLAFERVITIANYPVLRSHIIGGKAVVPMALMIEWLGHGAIHHNPGLSFAGLDDLRVFQGIKLTADDACNVQVTAGDAVATEEGLVVPVELRSDDVLHAGATVILSSALSHATPSSEPSATAIWPAEVANYYDNGMLFHGPDLHAIDAVQACDAQGITASVHGAPAASQWIQQPLRSEWLADPLLLDAVFQLMILWSTQQCSAPSLPTAIERYRQYVKRMPTSGVHLVARITHQAAHHAEADIELIDEEGRLVAEMTGYQFVIDQSLAKAFAGNQLPQGVGH